MAKRGHRHRIETFADGQGNVRASFHAGLDHGCYFNTYYRRWDPLAVHA
jgi:hypothetical protein